MTFSPRILLTLSALISIASGCSELTHPTPPAPPVNTPPTVSAGRDAWVPLPSSAVLTGRAADKESFFESFSWKKVSGPASYSIESPNSLQTKVANLAEGTYQFEFTVTDKGGLTGKDTVAIFAYEPRTPGANELIFKKLEWSCPFGCLIEIANLHDYVPTGTTIKVFLKSSGATEWIEVNHSDKVEKGDRYEYGIGEGGLVIYTVHDEVGTADVKITF